MTLVGAHASSLSNDSLVEVEPALPIPVFTSMEPWQSERIGALALYCSDGRWGEAFDDFCHKCLQIPRYDRWAVPGGPAWLAENAGKVERQAPNGGESPDAGELADAARRQLDFLVRVHELERIVLITHYGCAAYGHRLGLSPQKCLPAQIDDVTTAAAVLRSRYGAMRVEGYLAMRQVRCLSFHEIGVWGAMNG